MRTIKFRGRIPKKDGTVKLFYQENQYLLSFLRRLSQHLIWEQSGVEKEHESYLEGDLESYLERWTGLLDKNGKEIYEGDVVRYRDDNTTERTVKVANVYWMDWADWAKVPFLHPFGSPVAGKNLPEGRSVETVFVTPPSESEVIGNIHENPELLKV